MFGLFRRMFPPSSGPDFSDVDSVAKAEALLRQGRLEKLLMCPPCFGGEDNRLNTLYVPIGTAEIKARIDTNTIAVLAAEGKVTRYKAKPEYQDKSVVPIAVTITASDPGQFTATINIWGKALKRNSSATQGTSE